MNWRRIKEEGELYGTYYPVSRDTLDAKRIIAREGEINFPPEYRMAVIEEMQREEETRLAYQLRPDFPHLPMKKIRDLCREYMREIKWPKKWRVDKELTRRRKLIRKERGY